MRTAYLAPEGFEAELAFELGEVELTHGRLLLAAGPPRPVPAPASDRVQTIPFYFGLTNLEIQGFLDDFQCFFTDHHIFFR